MSWASRKYEAGDSSCSCEPALVGWDKMLSVYMDFPREVTALPGFSKSRE